MSPGKEYHDYEHLYRLDVLGLANTSIVDQYTLDTEFQEQLQRNPKGWHQTWEPNHPNCYSNKNESLACLSNLLSELQHDPVFFKEYVDKIEEQLVEEAVRKAHAAMTWKGFYIPYKPAVKQ